MSVGWAIFVLALNVCLTAAAIGWVGFGWHECITERGHWSLGPLVWAVAGATLLVTQVLLSVFLSGTVRVARSSVGLHRAVHWSCALGLLITVAGGTTIVAVSHFTPEPNFTGP